MPLMFELLTTTLAAAVKSLAVKGVTGPVESVAKKALAKVNARPMDQATAAVTKAVEAARRDLTLGKILELLEAQWAAAAPEPSASLLAAEERYLRLLLRECNRLPLADDPRDVAPERVGRPPSDSWLPASGF